MPLGHLRLASGIGRPVVVAHEKPDRDICFMDYAQCEARDTCWVLDMASGCEGHDGCIVDTN